MRNTRFFLPVLTVALVLIGVLPTACAALRTVLLEQATNVGCG